MNLLMHTATLAASVFLAATSNVMAHSDRGEKRPQTFADAVIPMTPEEWRHEPKFRHPPGNVRVEDMRELFGNIVHVVNQGREYATDGSPHHIIKVIFLGRDGRFVWCTWNEPPGKYNLWEHVWAPVKYKHDGMLWHRLDPAIHNDRRQGQSPLYDGTTGQIVMYARGDKRDKRIWTTHNVGHLQERLPRAVYTLCPDFPPAEELGVGINKKQTATTYDALIAQNPGRRILRPDLITPDPTEPAQ